MFMKYFNLTYIFSKRIKIHKFFLFLFQYDLVFFNLKNLALASVDFTNCLYKEQCVDHSFFYTFIFVMIYTSHGSFCSNSLNGSYNIKTFSSILAFLSNFFRFSTFFCDKAILSLTISTYNKSCQHLFIFIQF